MDLVIPVSQAAFNHAKYRTNPAPKYKTNHAKMNHSSAWLVNLIKKNLEMTYLYIWIREGVAEIKDKGSIW